MRDLEKAKALFFAALDLLERGDFRGAETLLRRALSCAPGHADILTNLSVALLQQNKGAEACKWAEMALAASPDSVEALLVLAQGCTLGENYPHALAAYDRLLALDPTLPEAHNSRGSVLEKLGRRAEALASFDRAIAIAPQFAPAHVNRGCALDDPDEALAAFTAALALEPDLAEGWLGRGNVLDNLDRPEQALAAYERALGLKPELTHAWLGRGNVCSTLRRNADSLAAFDRALALDGKLVDAWLGRGNALRNLRRWDEALAAFDKALSRQPALVEAWLGRGNVFFDCKRYEDALAAYDSALAHDASLASGWLARGHALRLLKRTDDAIAAYRHALTRGAEVETTTYNLAGLGAEPPPAAPPRQYVVDLFDAYAGHFEQELVGDLKYRAPALLADMIHRFIRADILDILDLGCGTGLMGEALLPLKRSLIGVDLSIQMLERARSRGIYDGLNAGELIEFLLTQDQAFDLAVAADVFNYIGDLSPAFEGGRKALRAGGLFCFSVEAADEDGYVLRPTSRYAHSLDYLRGLAVRHGFIIETIEPQVIRRDLGASVGGHFAILRKP